MYDDIRRMRLLWFIVLALPALACGLTDQLTPTAPPPLPTSTSAPQATATPELIFTDHDAPELGLSFSYPQTWQLQVQPEDSSVVIVSEEALLTSEQFDREGAGIFMVVGARDLFGGDSLEASLQSAIEQFEFADNTRIVEGPERTTINGQESVVATVEGTNEGSDQTLLLRVTLMQSQERAAFVAGVTLQSVSEQYRSTLDTIAQSVTLQQPATTDAVDRMGNMRYGDTVEGAITSGNAISWNFIGVEGERIDITVRPLEEQLDVSVDVQDSQGSSVLPDGPVDNSFGIETIRGLILPSSAQYTVVVRGFGQSSGDFELVIGESDALSSALAIAVGDTLNGSLEPDEQEDYLLSEAGPGAITVILNPVGELDVVLEVLDGSGAIVFQEDRAYGQEQLTFTPDANESYILRVRGFAGAAGDYAIAVQSGGVGGSGTTLVTTATLEANDEDGHDFPFWAEQGDLVQAIVEPEGEFDVVVEIWNDDTDELAESIDASFGREQVNFVPTQSGNYFFRILGFDGAGGTYTITLNGPPLTVFELLPGDQISGDLGESTQIEYYIRLNEGESITVNAVPDQDTDVVVEVLDLNDTVLESADDGFAGELEQLTFNAPTAGEEATLYIVRIRNFSGEPGGTFNLTME